MATVVVGTQEGQEIKKGLPRSRGAGSYGAVNVLNRLLEQSITIIHWPLIRVAGTFTSSRLSTLVLSEPDGPSCRSDCPLPPTTTTQINVSCLLPPLGLGQPLAPLLLYSAPTYVMALLLKKIIPAPVSVPC
jgi:hypothetical protein